MELPTTAVSISKTNGSITLLQQKEQKKQGAIDNISDLQSLDALSFSELEEWLHILLPLVGLIHGHLNDLAALCSQDQFLGRCCSTKNQG